MALQLTLAALRIMYTGASHFLVERMLHRIKEDIISVWRRMVDGGYTELAFVAIAMLGTFDLIEEHENPAIQLNRFILN